MSKYVFDTGPLRILVHHFYQDRFPTLWNKFELLVEKGNLFSVREVFQEITRKENDLLEWAKTRKDLFRIPTEEEINFVTKILKIAHFQQLVSNEQRLTGYPAADPFVIACGKVQSAIVVTTEQEKPNSAKMPNVCKHFKIECIELEEFMKREKWRF